MTKWHNWYNLTLILPRNRWQAAFWLKGQGCFRFSDGMSNASSLLSTSTKNTTLWSAIHSERGLRWFQIICTIVFQCKCTVHQSGSSARTGWVDAGCCWNCVNRHKFDILAPLRSSFLLSCTGNKTQMRFNTLSHIYVSLWDRSLIWSAQTALVFPGYMQISVFSTPVRGGGNAAKPVW